MQFPASNIRWTAVLVCATLAWPGPLAAQEPEYREDLRFVEKLRERNDHDLALQFLERMKKGASPELAKELPLEFAKTRLRIAGDEPDGTKRLAFYKEAGEDLKRFIAANPGHPRTAEANLDIARLLNLQGKTELNQALLDGDPKGKADKSKQARQTLEQAGIRLRAAAKVLEAALDKLPEPESEKDLVKRRLLEAQRQRARDEVGQTRLDIGLNLYDQAQTYLGGMGDTESSALLEKAQKELEPIAGGAPASPITWKARAWLGRIILEIESAAKARVKFQEVIGAGSLPAAFDGGRLARYFRMLLIHKFPSDQEKKKGVEPILVDAATRWLQDYPRYRKTPEGYGVCFLLAQMYMAQAEKPKLPANQAERLRNQARALLREVETSENDFSLQARQLKIDVMHRQKLFDRKLADLKTWEDCYVRAQYEMMMIDKDAKDFKDPKELQKKQEVRIRTLTGALEKGLKLPDAKRKDAQLEVSRAKLTLAYYALQARKYEEAIAVGEGFARDDPRSPLASLAAIYALEAYPRLIDQKKKKNEEEAAEARAAMFRLASYMEARWPRELAADKARYEVGWQLGYEKNYPEAIQKLSSIGPTFPAYARVQSYLASFCFKAEEAEMPLIPGDRKGDYKRRGLHALASIPDSSLGPDPEVNSIYVGAKAALGREWYKQGRYKEMETLAAAMLKRIPSLKFGSGDDDAARRNDLRDQMVSLLLSARYGLAYAAFAAGNHPEVVALLDPLVDQVIKREETPEKVLLKKNQRLATAILGFALRSNVQLRKTDRADLVLDALDQVSEDNAGGDINMLKLLAVLIKQQVEDLRKQTDKEALTKAIDSYGVLLGKRVKKLADKKKAMPSEFVVVLADCYSSMGLHAKAADELSKATVAKNPKQGSPEEVQARGIQLRTIREWRLSKDAGNLKKATAAMETIMGDPKKKPGWGRKNLDAILESGILLAAKEEYKKGFAVLEDLVRRLAPKARGDNRIKEAYLEASYWMIYCYFKNGEMQKKKEDRDKALRMAGRKIADLESSWDSFGSDASRKRFEDLLAQERGLHDQYLLAKKKKK
jgi:hypothetical protein